MFLKFPVVYLHPEMKQKIIDTAQELFLNIGFKSVTMDDIANQIGVSKKTIYLHFENKTALVSEVTINIFNAVCNGIEAILQKQMNPIQEMFEMKKFVMEYLKDEKSSPQYQLQKYYPALFENIKKRQFEFMQDCIKKNLEKGVESGSFFREYRY